MTDLTRFGVLACTGPSIEHCPPERQAVAPAASCPACERTPPAGHVRCPTPECRTTEGDDPQCR